MAKTLAQLRTESRQRADKENSTFISDSELTSYINNSIAELYDILCEAYGADYFVISSSFSVQDGVDSYDLPADFYILKGVDMKLDNQNYINVRQFNFNERNRFADIGVWDLAGITNVRYRLVGDKIMFTPKPDRNAEIKLWYVPLPAQLVADSDTLDDFNAYSEYVIVDAAIKMMQKEESDVTVLMMQKQALEKRIRDRAQVRDASQPQSITDIYAESDGYYWRSDD